MNNLYVLQGMGFKVPWKLIAIGLFGDGEIPPSITRSDVVEYLDCLLTAENEQTDDAISLFCEKDDTPIFDRVLKDLASRDTADSMVQKRKWRACLLKNLMEHISKDYLQGLLDLMEFWVSMGRPSDCPQTFPSQESKESTQEYFTQASYEFNVNNNQKWLRAEVESIVKLEA